LLADRHWKRRFAPLISPNSAESEVLKI